MKQLLVLLLLCASVLAPAAPQVSADDPVNGELEDGVYSNSRYGFEFKIPAGWTVAPEENLRRFEAARADSSGSSDLRLLLAVFRPSSNPGTFDEVILVSAARVGGNYGVSLNGGMAYFKASRPKLKGAEITRPAAPYLLGGLEVARQDFHSTKEAEQYVAHFVTVIRDRLISFQVISVTPAGLEEGVRHLAGDVQFEPDWVTKNNSDNAHEPSSRIRISESTLLSLVDKKVTPELPGDLTPEDIKVPVQMHLLVSSSGTVEKIWVFEGSPSLSWPAVAAVRQWHFRPYLQNGQSVPLESTLTVDFR